MNSLYSLILSLTLCTFTFFLAYGDVAALTFTDISTEAGFFGQNNTWGAAWADYDDDGYLDVYTLGHAQQKSGSISQLWRNNGNGTFSDVTLQAGLNPNNGDAHGAVWGDFDSDGYLDLYVAKGSPKFSNPGNYNELWRNNGNGIFTDVALSSGVTGIGHRGRGVYSVDYDYNGDLDIFILSFTRQKSGIGNLLYRNNGNMSFVDVAQEAGLARERIPEWDFDINRTAGWSDFNGDGFIDVFFSNPCGLFLNRGDGTFVDVTVLSGIVVSPNCTSAAWGDYDNDGDSDLYVTMSKLWSKSGSVLGILYQNDGNGAFTDVTLKSGAVNEFDARGVIWGDYDNDGNLDLYVVNRSHQDILFRNNGNGTFTDVTSETGLGIQKDGNGTDATFIDYNNDGFFDLFVTVEYKNYSLEGKSSYVLYRNNRNDNSWLKIKLKGQQSNPCGIGAKVSVTTGDKTQMRKYNGFSHYMSQDHVPIHFGLGHANVVDELVIKWPSGITQTLTNITPNQSITIVEGGGVLMQK